METETFPSQILGNQLEPRFTLLPLPVSSKVPLSPIITRRKKTEGCAGWAVISGPEGAKGEENMRH